MTFCRLALINESQKGFTLIELMVGLAIIASVMVGVTASIFQTFNVNTKSVNHMTASMQVQNAGHWFRQDIQMAQVIATDDDVVTPETEVLTLLWVSWERRDQHNNQLIDTYAVSYAYDNNKIWRNQKVTTDKYDSDGSFIETIENITSSLIAEHITTLAVSATGGMVTVGIVASVGDTVEDRTYEITPRPTH